MSNELINDYISYFRNPYGRTIIGMKNRVIESVTGIQQVFSNDDTDRRRFSVNLSDYTRAERDEFLDFFLQMGGNLDTFLFDDFVENFVSRNTIGTADGVETEFQLKKIRGSQSFNRYEIATTPAIARIWDDSVEKFSPATFTIDTTESGIVTFAVAPLDTHVIEAEFYFLRRCRFIARLEDIEANYEQVNMTMSFDEVTPSGV